MSKILDANGVAEELTIFAQNKHTILFAGAGVGNRVDLPTWYKLLFDISVDLESRGLAEESALMRKQLFKGQFLAAASIVRTCDDLLASERYSLFAAPFLDDKVSSNSLDKLETLVKFSSSGIVTTNYDRALTRAYAKFHPENPAIPIEFGDGSMRGAATKSEYIIARIHGRVEIANTIKICSSDYTGLKSDPDYRDFITRLLEFRQIIFVGFSFNDPAIDLILETYKNAFFPNYPEKHIAFIPDSAPDDLIKRLHDVNIKVCRYYSNKDHHALWDGFRIHYESKDRVQPELGLPAIDQGLENLPETELHRFLAFAYAQSKLPNHKSQSLVELTRESAVLSIIAEKETHSLQRVTIVEKLRQQLRLTEKDAEEVVEKALESLVLTKSIAVSKGGLVSLTSVQTNQAEELLTSVSTEVVTRCKIVYDIELTSEEAQSIPKSIEEIFLARAWDLGAYYAGASVKPNEMILRRICYQTVSKNVKTSSDKRVTILADSLRDVFARPPKRNVANLAKLGRAAFAVQLAFSSPSSALFQSSVLPDVLYFDSNIIMPAIVNGHPLQSGYMSAVMRLIDANSRSGQGTMRRIGFYFLNEIVKHRNLAIEIADQLNLDDYKRLTKYVAFEGASHVNVFISGYASHRFNNQGNHERFSEYLKRTAPYTSEEQLERFLENTFRISTARSDYRNTSVADYNIIFNDLQLGYERSKSDTKKSILIHHEAEQIMALVTDIRRGHKPVFVTADTKLRKIISNADRIAHLSASIVSDIAFIGLVDLIVGLDPDPEIYTRLLWGMNHQSSEEQVRDYILSKSVSSYNEAIMTEMPYILDSVIQSKSQAIASLNNSNTRDAKSALARYKFIDEIDMEYLKRHEDRIMELRKRHGSGEI